MDVVYTGLESWLGHEVLRFSKLYIHIWELLMQARPVFTGTHYSYVIFPALLYATGRGGLITNYNSEIRSIVSQV